MSLLISAIRSTIKPDVRQFLGGRVIWQLPAFTGGGRPPHVRISKYVHVWVESATHRRSAGRPTHMQVFVLSGYRTHAVSKPCFTSDFKLFMLYKKFPSAKCKKVAWHLSPSISERSTITFQLSLRLTWNFYHQPTAPAEILLSLSPIQFIVIYIEIDHNSEFCMAVNLTV